MGNSGSTHNYVAGAGIEEEANYPLTRPIPGRSDFLVTKCSRCPTETWSKGETIMVNSAECKNYTDPTGLFTKICECRPPYIWNKCEHVFQSDMTVYTMASFALTVLFVIILCWGIAEVRRSCNKMCKCTKNKVGDVQQKGAEDDKKKIEVLNITVAAMGILCIGALIRVLYLVLYPSHADLEVSEGIMDVFLITPFTIFGIVQLLVLQILIIIDKSFDKSTDKLVEITFGKLDKYADGYTKKREAKRFVKKICGIKSEKAESYTSILIEAFDYDKNDKFTLDNFKEGFRLLPTKHATITLRSIIEAFDAYKNSKKPSEDKIAKILDTFEQIKKKHETNSDNNSYKKKDFNWTVSSCLIALLILVQAVAHIILFNENIPYGVLDTYRNFSILVIWLVILSSSIACTWISFTKEFEIKDSEDNDYLHLKQYKQNYCLIVLNVYILCTFICFPLYFFLFGYSVDGWTAFFIMFRLAEFILGCLMLWILRKKPPRNQASASSTT